MSKSDIAPKDFPAWKLAVIEHFTADKTGYVDGLRALLDRVAVDTETFIPNDDQLRQIFDEDATTDQAAHFLMSVLAEGVAMSAAPPRIKMLLLAMATGAAQAIVVPDSATPEEIVAQLQTQRTSAAHADAADRSPLTGGIAFGGGAKHAGKHGAN